MTEAQSGGGGEAALLLGTDATGQRQNRLSFYKELSRNSGRLSDRGGTEGQFHKAEKRRSQSPGHGGFRMFWKACKTRGPGICSHCNPNPFSCQGVWDVVGAKCFLS